MWRRARPCESDAGESHARESDEPYEPDEPCAVHQSCDLDEACDPYHPNKSHDPNESCEPAAPGQFGVNRWRISPSRRFASKALIYLQIRFTGGTTLHQHEQHS
ncbi:hypothetical protein A5753_20360 [Mycobacterium sp. 852002-51971_SCH5477799-a]|nr:hypothetical protein A5753_20360 [Mycobacterium sp. 852002-51971_SCH5477799-a]